MMMATLNGEEIISTTVWEVFGCRGYVEHVHVRCDVRMGGCLDDSVFFCLSTCDGMISMRIKMIVCNLLFPR